MKPKRLSAVLFLFVPAVLLSGGRLVAKETQLASEGAVLVRQLGHSEYLRREEATARLSSLGLQVRGDLIAGLRAGDPEVRRRSRRILVRLLDADYRRRIATMLADQTGGEHDLPGWAWYRQAVGNHEQARKLFAAMLVAESGLFVSAQQGPEYAEEAFTLRLAQLHRQQAFPNPQLRRQPSVESVAALLLVAGNPRWQLPSQLVDHPQLINFIRGGEFVAALNRGVSSVPTRRLVGHWMLVSGSPNVVQQKLRMALQYEIHEGLPLALAMLQKAESQPPNLAAMAAETVARLGGKRYVAAFIPLLEDERQCARAGNRGIEVRDVALAWLVQATGQDIEAYGQSPARSPFQTRGQKPGVVFNFSQFGYEKPEHRSEALAKWAEWMEANPLPPPSEQWVALVTDRPAGQPQIVPPAAEPWQPAVGGLAMADRDLVRRLRDAERLASLGEYSSAVRIVGLLLASEGDFFFQADRNVPVFRHLKSAAESMLGLMPSEGRAAYELQYGAEARRRLDVAVRGTDRQQLAQVSQDYFHAEAGAEATYLLGATYWQAGQWFSAAACWQRLADSGHRARRFEPALSLQLAACWLALGEPSRVSQRLESLKARHAGASIEIAGRQVGWFEGVEDAPHWLVAVLGSPPSADEATWGMFRGRPSRNPLVESGGPYLAASPLDTSEERPLLRNATEHLRTDLLRERRAALPTFHPLVVRDTIVFRTATRIRAVHAGSGELLWEVLPDDALADLLASPGVASEELERGLLPAELPGRLWQNLAYGTLSSDGRSVFAVEQLPMQRPFELRRMAVRPDGTRRLESDSLGRASILTAYDLSTGKLRWELGGSSDGEERPLAGVCFLGPPLPLGASLYCIAEVGEKTVLLALDAATGAVQWQRVLAVRDELAPDAEGQMDEGDALRADDQPRANGVSPSYADGTLVCPIADDQVAAVDLASRSVVWLYQRHAVLGSEPLAERRIRLAQTRSQTGKTPPDQWADPCATVAQGHALLATQGHDRLICLRMVDGMELWTAPRGDGLYVGGVDNGIVLVVGRSGVRGLRLADGKSAWKNDLSLPPGALPSGRGFISRGRLYIPLTTAEVLGVDAATGSVVSRSRSPAGIVPGNLVGLGGCVVSQSVNGLWRFDLTTAREARAAERIEQTPDNAAAWAERGELLLCDGRIAEAIECLLRARELKPTAALQLQLARAVTDGLWADYERFRPAVENLALEEMDLGQRTSVLRAIGWSAQHAGDRGTALDAFLSLAQIDPAADAVQPLSAAVRVRRDRWLAARLDELLDGADSQERAMAADQFASLSDEARVRYLPFQPATVDARVRIGANLAARDNAPAAEQYLRAALWFARPDTTPEGAARLTDLLLRRRRPREAARLVAMLAGPMADRVCLDGRTGRQLLESFGAGEGAQPDWVVRPQWPMDALEATTEQRDGRQPIVFHAPVRVRAVEPSLDRPANVRVENSGRALYGYDDLGRQAWEIPLKPTTANVGFRNSHYLAEGAQLGRILVVWLVGRVCAIDLSDETPRLLWDHETTSLGANDPRQSHRVQRANQRRARPPGGVVGDELSPLLVAHGIACFERNDELVAVDLETGALLWARDDISKGIDLFGDARFVFVVPAEGTDEARVLSSLDGRELGRRSLPARSNWLAAIGRRLLVWETGRQPCRIRLVDAWSGETAWERERTAQTQVCLVRPDGVAALDPEGRFAVWHTDSGESMVEAQLDIPPALEQVYVEPYGSDLLVLANRPPEPAGRPVSSHAAVPAVNANGRLLRVTPEGHALWSAEVVDQQLELDLPPELPVLLFSKRRQHQVARPQGGMINKVEYAVLCLDKRTGETVHEETVQSNGQEMEIRAVDPKGGRIEVITQPLHIQITRVKESQ